MLAFFLLLPQGYKEARVLKRALEPCLQGCSGSEWAELKQDQGSKIERQLQRDCILTLTCFSAKSTLSTARPGNPPGRSSPSRSCFILPATSSRKGFNQESESSALLISLTKGFAAEPKLEVASSSYTGEGLTQPTESSVFWPGPRRGCEQDSVRVLLEKFC